MTLRTFKSVKKTGSLTKMIHIIFEIIFYLQVILSMFFNRQMLAMFRKFNLVLAIASLLMGWGSLMLIVWLGTCFWSIMLRICSLIGEYYL